MDEIPARTLQGIVEKLIISPMPNESTKAGIHIEGADKLFQELRIENILTNEKGEEVSLKPGAKVEVTVEAKAEDETGKSIR